MTRRDRMQAHQTIRWKLILTWLCICSATLAAGQPESSTTIITTSSTTLDDTYNTDSLSTTTTSTSTMEELDESESLAPSTERTSNSIPEAEQSNSELSKKYNGKKHDKEPNTQSDQLDKPYPYLKKTSQAKEDKENAIHQTKRSGQSTNLDSLSLNGTLKLSISPKNSPESLQNVEETIDTTTTTTVLTSTTGASTVSETTVSTVEEEVSTMPPTLVTTSADEDETTVRNTQLTTEFTTITDKSTLGETNIESENSSVGETDTESVTLTTQPLPTTLTPLLTSITSTAATTSQSSSSISSVDETNAPTTIAADSLSTTLREESSTSAAPVEQDQSTITSTTPATTVSTTLTTTTTEPTELLTSSTRISSETASLLPVTTLTTTSTSATTGTIVDTTGGTTAGTTAGTSSSTTAKPSTTMSVASPKKTATTTTTSETLSAVTTWQDETSAEPTTEPAFTPTPPEDVTLLVRIVLEGNWQDVCSKLPILRQSLTELLNRNADKPISGRQIIFHQTQCSEKLPPTSLAADSQLTPVLVYVVDENGNFDGKLTKIIPSLYESSPIDFPLKIHSVQLVPEADSGNAIAVVIVSCVAFICLILLAGLLFLMRKRQGRFNYGERCRPVSLDAYSLDSVSAYNSVRRSKAVVRSSKRSYGNPAFEDSSVTPTHPLNFAGISRFCNDVNAVSEEFTGIPQIHSKIEELPPGAEIKNRYANVIPLPETRVPLQRINNEPLSEYINASYVRGPKNAMKYYIACQAPTEGTVADFWRMIWEQQCKVVIMLTDLVENGVDKCTEYIPPLEVSDCHRLYGDYQVTLKKREAKEKYAISTLHLKNLENNTYREVSHIWYLWPASGVPTDAAGLIAVLLEARALQRGAAGPILVHCSPGTGRTGTLIALDLCIRQYEVTRTVDVPRVVYTIRRDRAGAVQTREQYLFIYKGLNLYASKLAGGGIDST